MSKKYQINCRDCNDYVQDCSEGSACKLSKCPYEDKMKKYQIIYADPPWRQTKGGLRKCRPKQEKTLDYTTLTYENIRDYLGDVINHYADDCHALFLWTIDKYLLDAERMALELGYNRHARIIWDKTNGIAPAFTVRYSHEYLLWFYRNKFQPVALNMRGKYKTVFSEQATKHSKKPEFAYKMIEDLYPQVNKLELFARNKRKGWDVWGNEVENDIEL